MLARTRKEGWVRTPGLVALAIAAWALVPSGYMVVPDGAGALRIVPCTDAGHGQARMAGHGHHGTAGHSCSGFCPTELQNFAALGLLGLALVLRRRRPPKGNSGIPLRGSTRIYRPGPQAQWRGTA